MQPGQSVMSNINFENVRKGMLGKIVGNCNDLTVPDQGERVLVRFENGRLLNMHKYVQISLSPHPVLPITKETPIQEPARGAQDDDIGTSLDASPFVEYQAGRNELNSHIFVKHTDPVVESTSLSAVIPPAPSYRFKLPLKTLTEGRLTNLQIETLVYACTQHEKFLPSGHRMGFFMGDGPGLGKGRQIAGIIFENFLRGRKKSIWLSTSADLIDDARRDLSEIGAGKVRVHDLRGFHISDDLRKVKALKQGVLFVTYHLLVGVKGDQSRLKQILQWCGLKFEGVLALDECHSAKNLSVRKARGGIEGVGGAKGSKSAIAVHMLQEHLKSARVIYVSATGASKPDHLVYASRLGLWGKGGAFNNSENFVSEINAGGVAAMELLAIQMKASGQYLARSLAFKGATFEVVNLNLTEEFREMYDNAAKLWLDFISALHAKLEIHALPPNLKQRRILCDLWGTHQRFWCTMCISAKVPGILEIVEHELKEDKCVIIGLQKTGESAVAKFNALSDPYTAVDPDDLGHRQTHWNEIPSTAKAIFLRFVSKTSSFMGDEWIRKVQKLKLPPNPLDLIINSLGGVGKVAEMTGRSKRVIFKNNCYKLVSRGMKVGLDTVNVRERKRFQSGRKLIAIISEAASTGISLQSDKRVPNQRRRVHITLELPWSAEKAIQQMGRSHRSNQICPPEFKILMTPIGGEWRISSTVARKLQALGALTHGDRLAAGGASSLNHFAIADSKYGHQAIASVLSKLEADEVAKNRLKILGIDRNLQCSVKVFLNRLLGIPLDSQTKIFEAWMDEIEAAIFRAKGENVYAEGIVDIAAQSMVLESEEVVFKMRDGRETSHICVRGDRGISWEKALDLREKYSGGTKGGFYKSAQSSTNEKCMLLLRRDTGLGKGGSFQVIRPNVGFTSKDLPKSALDSYEKIPDIEAQSLWEKDFNYFAEKCGHTREEVCPGETCTFRKRNQHYHILTGSVLTFWETIKKAVDTVKIVRVILDCGRKIVGLLLPASVVPALIAKIKDHGRAVDDKEEAYEAYDMEQRTLKVNAIHANWMMNISKKVQVASVDANEELQEADEAEEDNAEPSPVFRRPKRKNKKKVTTASKKDRDTRIESGPTQNSRKSSGRITILESSSEEERDDDDQDDGFDADNCSSDADAAVNRKTDFTPEEVTGIGKELQRCLFCVSLSSVVTLCESIGLWEPSPDSHELFDDGTWGQEDQWEEEEEEEEEEVSDDEEVIQASADVNNQAESTGPYLRHSRAHINYYEDTESEEEQSLYGSDMGSESDASLSSCDDQGSMGASEKQDSPKDISLDAEKTTLTCASCKAALLSNDMDIEHEGKRLCASCLQSSAEIAEQTPGSLGEEQLSIVVDSKAVKRQRTSSGQEEVEGKYRIQEEEQAPSQWFVLEFVEIRLVQPTKRRRVDFRAIARLQNLIEHMEHEEKECLLESLPETLDQDKATASLGKSHLDCAGGEEVSPAGGSSNAEVRRDCDQSDGGDVAAKDFVSDEKKQMDFAKNEQEEKGRQVGKHENEQQQEGQGQDQRHGQDQQEQQKKEQQQERQGQDQRHGQDQQEQQKKEQEQEREQQKQKQDLQDDKQRQGKVEEKGEEHKEPNDEGMQQAEEKKLVQEDKMSTGLDVLDPKAKLAEEGSAPYADVIASLASAESDCNKGEEQEAGHESVKQEEDGMQGLQASQPLDNPDLASSAGPKDELVPEKNLTSTREPEASKPSYEVIDLTDD
eukprot:749277-Hanusia_phi.AAC.4